MADHRFQFADKLDDADRLARLDPKNVMGLTLSFAEQCAEARSIGRAVSFEPPRDITQIVVTGMGGSAVGGDFLRALFEAESSVPVMVNRDYDLPRSVGINTLVVAISYSGNTEETNAAFTEAGRRKAKRLTLTSGGELASIAERDRCPVIRIPGGRPPRTALGYVLLPLFELFAGWGMLADNSASERVIERMSELRDQWRPETPTKENQAKQLASNMFQRLPLFYAHGYKTIVAARWKTQMNENAKSLAYVSVYPELTHNEIVGWQEAGRQARNLSVFTLTDEAENPRVQARMKAMATAMQAAAYMQEVSVAGSSDDLLDRMLSLTYLGDFVSLYLAALYEVDPYDITPITELKRFLAEV